MAATDSFSFHGFIYCFNHHIGHAALLQSNANEHKHFNLLATVNEILVSHTETYESWYYDFKEIIFSKR